MSKTLIAAILIAVFCWHALPAFGGEDDPANWRQRKVTKERATGASSEDVSEEIRFGREIAARIIGRFGLYDNEDLTRYVNLVGRALALNTERQELKFHFAVLDTDEINAYAGPGGYVFVTKGAIRRMQDESELAGVLAHEISHVTQKHIVKALNIHGTDESAVSGFAHLIGGTSEAARTAFSQAVDKALDILIKDEYKREDEAQADRTAVSYLALAGYDPTGLPRYLARIAPEKEKTAEPQTTDHPTISDRIKWLDEEIKDEGVEPGTGKKGKQRFEKAISAMR